MVLSGEVDRYEGKVRIDLAEFSRRDLSGYLRVNDNFARHLDKVLGPEDLVWVHDYHLLPLAAALTATSSPPARALAPFSGTETRFETTISWPTAILPAPAALL
jgi:hypothetical protein